MLRSRAVFLPLLVVLAGPVSAQGDIETCSLLGDLAAQIMTNRQQGVAMSDMMRVAASGGSMADLAQSFVRAAFEEPRFSTEEHQQRAVEDFRAQVESICFSGP